MALNSRLTVNNELERTRMEAGIAW